MHFYAAWLTKKPAGAAGGAEAAGGRVPGLLGALPGRADGICKAQLEAFGLSVCCALTPGVWFKGRLTQQGAPAAKLTYGQKQQLQGGGKRRQQQQWRQGRKGAARISTAIGSQPPWCSSSSATAAVTPTAAETSACHISEVGSMCVVHANASAQV